MESTIDFLRRKGILEADATKWLVKFEDGREVDIVELINEHKQPSEVVNRFTALRARRGMILSDMVDDTIENSIKLYNRDIEKFFNEHPDWRTAYNLDYLRFPKKAMQDM